MCVGGLADSKVVGRHLGEASIPTLGEGFYRKIIKKLNETKFSHSAVVVLLILTWNDVRRATRNTETTKTEHFTWTNYASSVSDNVLFFAIRDPE